MTESWFSRLLGWLTLRDYRRRRRLRLRIGEFRPVYRSLTILRPPEQ